MDLIWFRSEIQYRRSRHGQDHMVVGFIITYAIDAYHHTQEYEFRSWRGVVDTTLCDKVCQ